MSDVHSPATRSFNMSQIRGRDTAPETLLRSELWKRGHRFRIHYRMIGRPDIVFNRKRVAIFVDGCFWHQCPVHYQAPGTNSSFWQKKIADNAARDELVGSQLCDAGWLVLRFWEHEICDSIASVAERVEASLLARPALPLKPVI